MQQPRSATILPFPSRDGVVKLPPPPAQDVQITFRVDLSEVRPTVWRRLEVSGSIPLDVLNEVLCMAMGWAGSHLHQFWPGRAWTGPRFLTDWDIQEEGEEGTAEADVRLDQVLRGPGDTLRWSYDFGDGWEHVLKAEKVRPAIAEDPPMRCLAGRNACPLDDCGGPPGHAEIRELLETDPGRAGWPEELKDWVPRDYDPNHFESDEVNLAIALIAVPSADVVSAFQAAVSENSDDVTVLADPVREYLQGLPAPAAAALTIIAAQSAHPGDEHPDLAGAVGPWLLMLDLAQGSGIPLTAAGWMKPAVVLEIASRTGVTDDWIGKANREDLTPPIADLRSTAMEAGLLRKYKGRLVQTKLGSSVRTDPDLLATALSEGTLRGKAKPAESGARILLLLHVAAGMSEDEATAATVDWMTNLGWSGADGRPISHYDVWQLTRPVMTMLSWAEGNPLHRHGIEYGPAARAIARRAVWSCS